MGAHSSTEVAWSLGSTIDLPISDGHIMPLLGLSRHIEKNYQDWLVQQVSNNRHRRRRPSTALTLTTTSGTTTSALVSRDGDSGNNNNNNSTTGKSSPVKIPFTISMGNSLTSTTPPSTSDADVVTAHISVNFDTMSGQLCMEAVSREEDGSIVKGTVVIAQPPRRLLREKQMVHLPLASDKTIVKPRSGYRSTRWMWLGKGTYRPFSYGMSVRLENRYAQYMEALTRYMDSKNAEQLQASMHALNSLRQFPMRYNKQKYTINMEDCVQKNEATKRVRPLYRYAAADGDDGGDAVLSKTTGQLTDADSKNTIQWQWEQFRGKMTPYAPADNARIEAMYQDVQRRLAQDLTRTDYHKQIRLPGPRGGKQKVRYVMLLSNPSRFMQINRKTGKARKVERLLTPPTTTTTTTAAAATKKAPTKRTGGRRQGGGGGGGRGKSKGGKSASGGGGGGSPAAATWFYANAAKTRWYKMSPQNSSAMEAAYSGVTAANTTTTKKVVAGIKLGRETYTADFDQLLQTNEANGKTRAIKRSVVASATPMLPSVTATTAVGAPLSAPPSLVESIFEEEGNAEEGKRARRSFRSTYLGHGEVEPLSGKRGICEVYSDQTGLYQCMLNKADVSANNNKFYFLQVLHTPNKPKECFLVARWGRVGAKGECKVDPFDSVDAAVTAFAKQFRKKSGNKWTERENFKVKRGSYVLMRIDNRSKEERETEQQSNNNNKNNSDGNKVFVHASPASTLHPLVLSLVEYISDKKDMNDMMANDFALDIQRMPLGRITQDQIQDAFTVLSNLEEEIKRDISRPKEILELTNMFYTLLPHRVPGHQRLPLIDNPILLKKKVDLLQSLGDIEIANEIMKRSQQGGSGTQTLHPMDSIYKNLQCELAPLADHDPVVERIRKYTDLTRGSTHHVRPEVAQVFSVRRAGEEARWEQLMKGGDAAALKDNVRMLWHGSRKTNFMGILSQGLRIAPPEAPSTGYMFGKGIYFSDVVTKASGYCHPVDNEGLMILSEVYLGKMLELGQSKYMEKAQVGYHSTNGIGQNAPVGDGQMHDKVMWPIEKVRKVSRMSTSLMYPEYIIYNPAQYKMRYIVRMKFRRA